MTYREFSVCRLLLAVCCLLLSAQVSFAAGEIRTEPVHFKKGTNSARIEGSIKGYETVDYVLGARAGQTMNVSLVKKTPQLISIFWRLAKTKWRCSMVLSMATSTRARYQQPVNTMSVLT